jgi:hypothetical protein
MRALVALTSLLVLGALNVPAPAIAAPAGEITHVSGAVIAQKPNGQSKILSVKSSVDEGDVLATSDNAYARVKFTDGGEVVLRPATQVKIDRFNFEEQKPQGDGMVLSLLKGGMRAVTGLLGRRNPAAVRVATPSATIGIRGTTFQAQIVAPGGGGALAPGLYVSVIDGAINLTNKGGSQNFSAGQFGYTPNVTQPPVVLPNNPGLQFNPPPAFSAPSGGLVGTVGKTGGLECTI